MSAASPKKKPKKDLFSDSSSSEDEEEQEAGNAEKSQSQSSSPKTDEKSETATSSDGASGKKKEDTSSAYDEEEEEEATEADKSFIDSDGDANADVVEEYAKQDQKFNDTERDEDFDGKKKGAKPELDREGALERMMSILHQMHGIADKDDKAIRNREPALHKLRHHSEIIEKLSHSALKELLLDPEAKLLEGIARWLRPSSTGLAALSVRNALYEFIEELDIDMERDLTYNDLGKVLMALRVHKSETASNRRRITVLIQKWTLKIQERLSRRQAELHPQRYKSQSRKRKKPESPKPSEEGAATKGDELETGVLKKRESSTRTSYLDQKLVEMGTDRIRRRQAKLAKRTVVPERRNANKIMNVLRKARNKR